MAYNNGEGVPRYPLTSSKPLTHTTDMLIFAAFCLVLSLLDWRMTIPAAVAGAFWFYNVPVALSLPFLVLGAPLIVLVVLFILAVIAASFIKELN